LIKVSPSADLPALVMFALLLTPLGRGALAADGEDFQTAVTSLASATSYSAKEEAANSIGASGHPRAQAVLSALFEGQIYVARDDSRVVIATAADDGFAIVDAVSGEPRGNVAKREISRVTVNNQLRGSLRALLATLRLKQADPRERIEAIREVGESEDLGMVDTLTVQRERETRSDVLSAIDRAIATLNLDSTDDATRRAAISGVQGDLSAHVRAKLTKLAEDDALDPETRGATRTALAAIERRVELNDLIQTAFFGLSLGSILVLAAIGLSVTFGIMGVINMAHGELMMLGAYTTYVVQQLLPNAIGASLFIAMPAAFLISGLFGIAIERGVVRFLYGRPLETLLATFGVSLVLQQGVRTVFSPLNRSVTTPGWMSGSWEILPGLDVTLNRLYILLFSMLVFGALLLVLRKTRFGLEMRAVMQNRAMAKAMGIRTDRVDALTFGLGSGIAGLAGVALSQLTNVGPNLGQSYIVDSFMVVVFGGVGSLWGTLVSGLSLGLASKLLEPAAGAVMAKIFVLIFLIVFIQKKPRGLFPQKGRAAEG
jgi:urea transport system permease protein